jgi:hypothetical protein
MNQHSAFPRQTVEAYLIQVLSGFQKDHATSDFQAGYHEALKELCRVFCPHLKRRFGID